MLFKAWYFAFFLYIYFFKKELIIHLSCTFLMYIYCISFFVSFTVYCILVCDKTIKAALKLKDRCFLSMSDFCFIQLEVGLLVINLFMYELFSKTWKMLSFSFKVILKRIFFNNKFYTPWHKMYSRSKEKWNTPIYFNTNYRTEMKRVPVIVDYCLLQFDALNFFLRVRLHEGSLRNFNFFSK